MPITLNHSNINVQYETGKNYNIETVKSDLYIRDSRTGISSNLTAEPVVTAPTFSESVKTFAHSGGSEAQTTHNITIGQNTICDILIVGGGGGGGYFGGGGGGGAVLFANNLLLSAGNYTIKVGKGGTGVSTNSQNGNNGENSSITINSVEYIAKGGGGGGTRMYTNAVGRTGNDGGSGGGGSHSNSSTIQGLGGASTKNTYTNWSSYGNNGGKGRLGVDGTDPNHASGGGGGAGSVGGDFTNSTGGGNGGAGMSFVSTFGTSVGHNGWFGGGGGGNTYQNVGNPGYGNGGNGLFGGGGNGGFDGGTELAAQDGLPNTGGGGGGSKYDGGVAADNDGGNGGSGFVIIKLKSITNAAVSEGTPVTNHKRLNFAYVPPPLIYDFTPYNSLATWTSYATSIGATYVLSYYDIDTDAVWNPGPAEGYLTLSLNNNYNYLTVTFGNALITSYTVFLKINGITKETCTSGQTKTYSQSYNNGDILTILEDGTGINANIIITLTNTNYITNTYTLNFPVPTLTDINNNSNIVLRGAYDISFSTLNSSIIPKANQYIPKPTTFSTSNISLRYHLLNPILDPTGAQWTYSSNNTNVYHMGSVGIGTTSPEYSLDVRGNIYSSSGGYTQSGLTTWSIASDRRIKENIVKASYEKCLENVKNIELYNFNFKDNYVITNDRHQLGFIAQEVQQVYPKAVEVGKMIMKNNDGIENILSLNTTQIEYTLYGAVKKLIGNIEEMENEIAEIENTSNITTKT